MRKRWYVIFVLAFLAYVVKNIFVGVDIDEAYGLTLGYRLVQGDLLIKDLWEPHQTSAIFTALFIWITRLFTGRSLNFLMVLLRAEFFVIQTAITWYVYRCFKECIPKLEKEECLLLGLAYFVTTPKCIFIPEYSNLHMWFSTMLALFLLQYYAPASKHYGRKRYLVFSGLMLACDVLAYPSMVIFFPVCLVVIWKETREARSKWMDLFAFAAPCLGGAVLIIGYVLTYMSVSDVLSTIPAILGDGSHRMSLGDKIMLWGGGFGEIALMAGGCGLVAFVIAWWKRKRKDFYLQFLFWWFLVQTVYQVQYWFHSAYNSGYPQLAYVMVAVLGLIAYKKSEKKSKIPFYLIGMAALNFVALNLFSNWKPTSLTVYLVLGILGGFLCFREYFCEKDGENGKKLLRILLVVFFLSEVFGRCIMMIGSDANGMTYEVRGICKKGIRAGIFTSYMNAYRYNNNYDSFPEIVKAGDKVLYLGPSQYYYMLGDCVIATPTTISTPEYDETLKLYFDLHPDRFPDVVVVESSYGDLGFFDSDDYIFTWIEEEFKPAEMEDYPYVRVYRKEQNK